MIVVDISACIFKSYYVDFKALICWHNMDTIFWQGRFAPFLVFYPSETIKMWEGGGVSHWQIKGVIYAFVRRNIIFISKSYFLTSLKISCLITFPKGIKKSVIHCLLVAAILTSKNVLIRGQENSPKLSIDMYKA